MPDKGRSRRRRTERLAPFGYLACTFALVAFAIPSVLRPPPDQTTNSAEFSPDAPPDEEPDAIISALQQAGSTGAGADLGAATTTTQPPVYKAVRGRCFGNPPRQLESVYSPPCEEAFTGDNGGSTHRGITRDEIRVGTLHQLTGTTSYEGCIPDGPPRPEETTNERTYRVLQEYFNSRYELYGRKILFCHVHGEDGQTDGDENERIKAQKADEVYKVFAALQETSPASVNELVRRGIVTYTLAQLPAQYYVERDPYLWNFGPDQTRLIDFGSEYICKKLAGKPPVYADDVRFDYEAPRKFGLISYDPPEYEGGPGYMVKLLKERCGVDLGNNIVRYDLSAGADPTVQLSSAIVQLASAGVTTIIYMGELISATVFTSAATQNEYFPEWFLPGFGGVDVDDALPRIYSQEQWGNAFGFTAYEIPVADPARECEVAYRSIDPDNSPDDGMCTYLWQQMVRMFGGFQEAGPNLTPETFRDAQFRLGYNVPDPEWRMAGGYGTGDYTYPDYYAEFWWDPAATHPNGDTGAYRYARGGKRYTYGEWATEDPHVYTEDGVTTRS